MFNFTETLQQLCDFPPADMWNISDPEKCAELGV